jgi:hypothetical protein
MRRLEIAPPRISGSCQPRPLNGSDPEHKKSIPPSSVSDALLPLSDRRRRARLRVATALFLISANWSFSLREPSALASAGTLESRQQGGVSVAYDPNLYASAMDTQSLGRRSRRTSPAFRLSHANKKVRFARQEIAPAHRDHSFCRHLGSCRLREVIAVRDEGSLERVSRIPGHQVGSKYRRGRDAPDQREPKRGVGGDVVPPTHLVAWCTIHAAGFRGEELQVGPNSARAKASLGRHLNDTSLDG